MSDVSQSTLDDAERCRDAACHVAVYILKIWTLVGGEARCLQSAHRLAMLRDKFGPSWMVLCEKSRA